MTRYFLTSTITISVYVDIEADSLAAAIDAAHEAPMQSLSAVVPEERGEWCTSGELDGEVQELTSVLVGDEFLEGAALEQAQAIWEGRRP